MTTGSTLEIRIDERGGGGEAEEDVRVRGVPVRWMTRPSTATLRGVSRSCESSAEAAEAPPTEDAEKKPARARSSKKVGTTPSSPRTRTTRSTAGRDRPER